MKKRLSLLLSLSCFTISQGIFLKPSNSQVSPDGTTNTTVGITGNDFTIEQGDRAGGNLFHSFSDFSVPTDGSAFFNNAADIVNIFSRVTGGNISNINGLLGANGGANLFLLNPAGIIFGEGASLDIGGSFFGSTADSIVFPDGEFSATNLTNPPLLTINAPIGLSFRDNPGDIVNRSGADDVGLQVPLGENITLVGGNINLQGGIITAPGGTVELGGLLAAGEIGINLDGSLSFPDGIVRADVTLTNQAAVNVRAGGGGSINVNARNLTLTDQSELFAGIAENMGSPTAQAGDITINATESVRIIGQESQLTERTTESVFFQRALGVGIRNNVGVSSARRTGNGRSNAIGNAGDITIETNILEATNVASISSDTFGVGDAGNINLNARSITIDGRDAVVNSRVRGGLERDIATGNGGDININTNSLFFNSGQINAGVLGGAEGNAGNVSIRALGNISVVGSGQISVQVLNNATGNSGNIDIDTGSLTVNGSRILADNQGTGNTGDITINATDSIVLDSIDQTIDSAIDNRISLIISQLQTDVVGEGGDITISAPSIFLNNFSLISTNIAQGSVGEAGNITINAGTINLNNGSVIDALTETNFDGGDITINADSLRLSNGGKIVTGADIGGNAGSINLNITGDIVLNNANPAAGSPFDEPNLQEIELQTGVFANNFPNSTGNGGSINISADSIDFEDQGSILVETVSGEGGNITLRVNELISLRNNSLISAEAGGTGNGGNVTINTNFIVAYPNQNSDILASANQGQGGNINITAEALFGIVERSSTPPNQTNDIDASSEFGLDGTVSIVTPDINRLQTDIELPNGLVESEQTVAQACQRDRTSDKASGLIVKGKGGVPPIPTEAFDSETILVEEQNTSGNLQSQNPEIKPIQTSMGDIYPARGIIKTEDGRIVLTAYTTTDDINTRTPHVSSNCS
ncbi:filamentous hemagglutinin family N-terminal domain [Xenococcus sp. PCC 7305]|uniref:two-partner secretion domain-containing protein n=1 Tax=Xenococcus sp. PCC 7305 TaxID=102125 RepID=UPI0002AC581F|nr:filamentous hemagglutinin N-terminal domain-containing protein [Xenococcus sp. PCC 7305]ELS04519.1 filamentous hemagglutinin family N-terminal domain [Xenococcus sp. PCC 7305]